MRYSIVNSSKPDRYLIWSTEDQKILYVIKEDEDGRWFITEDDILPDCLRMTFKTKQEAFDEVPNLMSIYFNIKDGKVGSLT